MPTKVRRTKMSFAHFVRLNSTLALEYEMKRTSLQYFELFPEELKSGTSIDNIDFDIETVDYTDIFNCRIMPKQFCSQFRITIAQRKIWPDYLSSPVTWPVLSERAATLIKKLAGKDVQMLPLSFDNCAEPPTKYFLLNVIRCLDCVDIGLSEHTVQPETEYSRSYTTVTNAVLKRRSIPKDAIIFRSKPDEIPLFISEVIAAAARFQGLTGMCFREVEVTNEKCQQRPECDR